jgi:ferredoxin, 2Fe-2S
MPLIVFTLANGGQCEADAKVGHTVLQAAERAGIDGFLAECGGSCTCGTCHCHLDPSQAHLFPAPEPAEDEMLDFVADGRTDHSRLACQLRITDAHEGLRVGVPARQV